MSNKIQIKRGLKGNLPILDAGEPAFTTDTKEFFIGDGSTNIEFAKQVDLEIANTQLLDMIYETAGGTATALTVPMKNLVNGYSKTFIARVSNGGTATTVNGKKLFKPGTTISPNLIQGKAYTIWYDSTGDCFFIKASAEGDAIAANVLAGKKFSNDDDTGIIGNMPSKGAQVYSPSTSAQTIAGGQYLSGAQTIAPTTGTANTPQVLSGYTFNSANGIGLSGTMPNFYGSWQYSSGITPAVGRLHMYPPKGYYDPAGSTGIYYDDAGFNAANIVSGKSIFGLLGNATVQSLGGRRYASGVLSVLYNNTITISNLGLSFTPSVISGSITSASGTSKFVWARDGYNSYYEYGSGGGSKVAYANSTSVIVSWAGYPNGSVTWYAWE
jgi:hypothetical protein